MAANANNEEFNSINEDNIESWETILDKDKEEGLDYMKKCTKGSLSLKYYRDKSREEIDDIILRFCDKFGSCSSFKGAYDTSNTELIGKLFGVKGQAARDACTRAIKKQNKIKAEAAHDGDADAAAG